MKFSRFILDNIEPILAEWESFAKSLPPGANMTPVALRNDAERMLRFIAADMETAQSGNEQAVKGRGDKKFVGEDSGAHAHGRLRLLQAFDLAQMVSEFRALRVSVIRLWLSQPGAVPVAPSSELIRFNEAIDQILAESVDRYASEMERSREPLPAALAWDSIFRKRLRWPTAAASSCFPATNQERASRYGYLGSLQQLRDIGWWPAAAVNSPWFGNLHRSSPTHLPRE